MEYTNGPTEKILHDAVEKMQKATEAALKQKFRDIGDSSIWRKDFWAETTDKYTLDKCQSND